MHVATPDFDELEWLSKFDDECFLITAAHNLDEVDRPADAVREIVARVKSTIRKEQDHVRYLHV